MSGMFSGIKQLECKLKSLDELDFEVNIRRFHYVGFEGFKGKSYLLTKI